MERTIGLAEVMDFPGVIHSSDRMSTILRNPAAQSLHSRPRPDANGPELSAYLCAGPTSDHEVNLGAAERNRMECTSMPESSITAI